MNEYITYNIIHNAHTHTHTHTPDVPHPQQYLKVVVHIVAAVAGQEQGKRK